MITWGKKLVNVIVWFLKRNTKAIGYADDTTICIKDDVGIIEVFNVIKKFVDASNSRINIKKTKVYGFGDWNNRIIWPIANLKIEVDYFTTLGITFSCNYDLALNNTWSQIVNKFGMLLTYTHCLWNCRKQL